MPNKNASDLDVPRPDVLDHAREFVEVVSAKTPGVYRKLLELGRYRGMLAEAAAFNHGKLYAWAEFLVFRDEFRARFPDASDRACINAFSRLFLKNDISVSNLVEAMEETASEEALLLQRKEGSPADPG